MTASKLSTSSSMNTDNVLLFTKAVTGRDFQFYIRNMYIMYARELDMSVPQFLVAYKNKEIPDPPQLQDHQSLLSLHQVFEDDILEILTKYRPKMVSDNPDATPKQTQAAIGATLRSMLNDYKIK